MSSDVAIIGSGISGLVCAHLLHSQKNIWVYEANHYIGGHTNTVDVTVNDKHYAVDTGFIVYNDWTYPNFIQLMSKLNVESQTTEMSFSVKNLAQNLEYNGNNLNSLFAQRRNLFRPKFYRVVSDILRFNKLCKELAKDTLQVEGQTLGSLLVQHSFSQVFAENYILPMCAAIWSASLEDVKAFPLDFFLRFFNNHGLLNITDRPQWRTLKGGSRAYIEPLTTGFRDKILLNSPVKAVTKTDKGYLIQAENQPDREVEQVIFACHSDQALSMLTDPSALQREILGSLPYSANEVVLHTDTSLLPKRPLAWASWNYLLKGETQEANKPASVTYNMNILQKIQSDTTFCVTLNNTDDIDPSKILRSFTYHHPQFSQAGMAAQQRRHEISGVNGLHFCGAYWYNGFHEDGVRSALDVCQSFGASL